MDLTKEINYFYYKMALYELRLMNDKDYYHGLSYNSLLYLNVIEQVEQCTVSKIAEMLNITRSAVTIKLNELVNQGAVVKNQSEEDRRVFYVKLSPQMEQTFSLYNEIFQKIEPYLRQTYSEEQLNLFGKILRTISDYEWRQIENE